MFITFEGINGCGKTTHSRWLARRLRRHGRLVSRAKEPNFLAYREKNWAALSEALYYYANRHHYLEKTIKPRLSKGWWVICDRFCDSTFVYQGYASGVPLETLKALHRLVLGEFYPSLTLILDVDPRVILERGRSQTMVDRYEKQGLRFQRILRKGFLRIAEEESPRTQIIDGSQSLPEVQKQIWRIVERLEGVGFEPT